MFATSVCSVSLCFLTVVTVETKSWLVLWGPAHSASVWGVGEVLQSANTCVLSPSTGAHCHPITWLQRVVVLRTPGASLAVEHRLWLS